MVISPLSTRLIKPDFQNGRGEGPGDGVDFPMLYGPIFFKTNNFSTTEDTIQLSLKQNICLAHVNRLDMIKGQYHGQQ